MAMALQLEALQRRNFALRLACDGLRQYLSRRRAVLAALQLAPTEASTAPAQAMRHPGGGGSSSSGGSRCTTSSDDEPPLLGASQRRQVAAAARRRLAEAAAGASSGDEVDSSIVTLQSGGPSVWAAAAGGDIGVLRAWLEGAGVDADARDPASAGESIARGQGKTPLYCAVAEGQLAAAAYLLRRGANCDVRYNGIRLVHPDDPTVSGATLSARQPRSAVCRQGDPLQAIDRDKPEEEQQQQPEQEQPSSVRPHVRARSWAAISAEAGAYIEVNDGALHSRHHGCLHVAAARGDVRMVRLLLGAAADVGAEDELGRTALTIAGCGCATLPPSLPLPSAGAGEDHGIDHHQK
jgi:hypothetical protein